MTDLATTAWQHRQRQAKEDQRLHLLQRLLELRVPWMRGRAERIAAACRILATAAGMATDELHALSLAARFHDVGMLAAPDGLLSREGPLTPEEKVVLDSHPDVSAKLVGSLLPGFPQTVEAIRCHHERPDGHGPRRLKAGAIPMMASIIALVEAVDSMANGRPHRRPMPLDQIQAEVERNVGTQFPAGLLPAFRRVSHLVYNAVCKPSAGPVSDTQRRPSEGKLPACPKSGPAVVQPASARSQPPGGGTPPVTPSAELAGSRRVSREQSGRALRELSPLVKGQELVRLIRKGIELKPLAPCVHEIMSVTANPEYSTDDVAKAVAADPATSVQVLRLANSPVYTRGRPLGNVKTAVQRLGIQQVRKLVMMLGVVQRYEGLASRHIDVQSFWEHSFACGLMATRIAMACRAPCPDDCFAWGALHDIGRLLLLEHASDLYGHVLETASQLGLPTELVERKLLAHDHCSIAKLALEQWRFPAEFVSPITSHHQSASVFGRLPERDLKGAAAVALADRMVHALLLGSSGNDTVYPLDEFVQVLGIMPDVLEKLTEDVVKEADSLKTAALVHGHTEDRPEFVTTVTQRLRRPIRPLHLSSEPRTDPYRILLTRLAGPVATGPPNVGVIYLRSAQELEKTLERYQAAEHEAALGFLPLIVICDKGEVKSQCASLKARSHAVLQTPLRLSTLVEILDNLAE